MITEQLEPMIKAQIANACGIQHFFLRDQSTGQFKRITDPDEIEAALNAPNASEGSTYWIFSKDPNGDGSPIVIRWQHPDPKESDGVGELPGEMDDKIRHARKVNGHVESNGESS